MKESLLSFARANVIPNTRAVVVLSGGQDSVTCLALAVHLHGAQNVSAIAFDYGQKHRIELEAATRAGKDFGVDFRILRIPIIDSVSALVDHSRDVSTPHPEKPTLPASFVRNRNALFLTYAHALAQDHGALYIYTGVCQTDFSGYPDCRRVFVDALNGALNLGYESGIRVLTPLMHLTKGETFALAGELGDHILRYVINHTRTCYNGDATTRHEWGMGCGTCPACLLRERGFRDFVAARHVQHGTRDPDAVHVDPDPTTIREIPEDEPVVNEGADWPEGKI